MTRVVMVDDEVDILDTWTELLEISEITVIKGHDGKDAVQLCTKHNPDYLLLDLSMPKYDGFYALEKLQELKSSVKVVVITGMIDDATHKKLDKFDIFAIKRKPVDIDELLKILV